LKYLDERGIAYERIPIREQPPTRDEIRKMFRYVGNLRKLFNVSGGDYKALGLKDKLPKMSENEALDLLASNGNLIKRPFVLSKDFGWVGFDEKVWKESVK